MLYTTTPKRRRNTVITAAMRMAASPRGTPAGRVIRITAGRPNPSVEPDKVALHEWEIEKQTPKIEQVAELMSHGVEPELASTATRDMADIVGACHLATIGRHLMSGVDADGNQMMSPLEE